MDFDISAIYNQMPDFTTHEEARAWFKEQFHDQFLLKTTDVIDGKRVFYYHLIKHPEKYEEFVNTLRSDNTEIDSLDLFESYSTIEISEDGNISFTI
ncbi:hypothetical protein OEV98_12940 [Caldibacillus lycopersici]|uniref:Uncharacterized protein n=1 Tax=Perspicuibacillus lycopersici TaxID=1325689 RepID=A0AAE3IX01_9BACI|nr:hypothetical protein [Perspicuibacillus lycopersici]MCU9614444.1 hypothetical protein [Perspicuibacillus lycopersici]